MKLLSITTLVAAALLCFTSCNKQYDTEVSDSQTGNNNGTGGSGGGFNWTGNAPFSAKINGTPFVPESVTTSEASGYLSVSTANMDGTSFIIVIPSASATPGKVLSSPTPAVMTYYGGASTDFANLMAYPGKVKIVTNDATTIEGYFYGDYKDVSGLSAAVAHVTEGYFKVTKP